MLRPPAVLLALLLAAGCGQFKTLSRADALAPDERLEYVVLATLSEDAGRAFLLQPDRAGRDEYSGWFWSQPAYASPGDSLRARYLARAERARELFGAVDLVGDDRVRAFIRNGPARRESFQAGPARSETLTITVNPAEIWTWDSLGLQQDFVKTGTAYRLVGEARFGPSVFLPMLEEVDGFPPGSTVPRPAVGVDFELSVARFRSDSDTVETEVHFGVPLEDLERVREMGVPPVLRLDFDWRGRNQRHHVTRRIFVSPVLPSDDAGLAVGRQVFLLPSDDYDLTVTVALPESSSRQVTRHVNLLDYVRRVQPASDMAFYSLADSTFQSPQFEGHGWRRLIPSVRPEVRAGGTLYVLYVLYNLTTDTEGNRRVRVGYDIYEESSHRLVVIPTPDKYLTGAGPTAVAVERLHVMDLAPGDYVVVARCRDELAARDITVTGRFRILPR